MIMTGMVSPRRRSYTHPFQNFGIRSFIWQFFGWYSGSVGWNGACRGPLRKVILDDRQRIMYYTHRWCREINYVHAITRTEQLIYWMRQVRRWSIGSLKLYQAWRDYRTDLLPKYRKNVRYPSFSDMKSWRSWRGHEGHEVMKSLRH